MAFLIRKISRAKWPSESGLDVNDLPSDAITGCLRTRNNQLSTWQVQDMDELEIAVLALGSSMERLETIHVVAISHDEVLANGLVVNNTDGNTPIECLRTLHNDVSELSYQKLGVFAYLVMDAINKKQDKRYTKTQIKTILTKAIKDGLLDKNSINRKLLADLEKSLSA